MRKGKFSGKTIYLTEKEWRESLKRFDLGMVVEGRDENDVEIYEIPSGGCYLCEKYRVNSRACGACPLNSEEYTCGDLMEDVVGGQFSFQAEVLSGLWWMKGFNREARAEVRKIHKALMNMERVGRRVR